LWKAKKGVIPASEARRESFWEALKDSGQAGMTNTEINIITFDNTTFLRNTTLVFRVRSQSIIAKYK
jgi:hypothetical protein